VNQNLNNKLKTPSNKQATRVRIPWKQGDSITIWDETCAWAIEHFGLPGDKYSTHPTEDYMDFIFKDERDAVHFELRWG
jgi:hypothetical protein